MRSSSSAKQHNTVFVDGMMLSLSLFGVTAYWFVRHARRQKNLLDTDTPFLKRRKKSLSDLDGADIPGEVSARGRTALVPPIPYLKQLLACFQVSRGYDLLFGFLRFQKYVYSSCPI